MPLMRYFIFVGSALALLLLAINRLLPESTAEPVHSSIERPVIRISSIETLPEAVVFDSSMPYMAPPSSVMRVAAQPLQSAFTLERITPGRLPTFSSLTQATPQKTITAKREPQKKLASNRVAAQPHTAAVKNYPVREAERDTKPPIKTTLLDEIAGRFRQMFKMN
jgi:hypothetical protein